MWPTTLTLLLLWFYPKVRGAGKTASFFHIFLQQSFTKCGTFNCLVKAEVVLVRNDVNVFPHKSIRMSIKWKFLSAALVKKQGILTQRYTGVLTFLGQMMCGANIVARLIADILLTCWLRAVWYSRSNSSFKRLRLAGGSSIKSSWYASIWRSLLGTSVLSPFSSKWVSSGHTR